MSKLMTALDDCQLCYGENPQCPDCGGNGLIYVSANRKRLNQVLAQIHQTMAKPHSRSLTSLQMAQREKYRRSIAAGARINGIGVRDEYNWEGQA